MFVLAVDIGYSNLKVVWGDTSVRSPERRIVPAGCGPREALAERIGGGKGEGTIPIMVNGVPWVAGVGHRRIESAVRELHEDYSSTEAWRALFLAALRMAGRDRIDLLVTGLPVSHHRDVAKRERLRQSIIGVHRPTPNRAIEVAQAVVLAQPAGAYLDLLSARPDLLNVFEQGRTVIFDPGFFSTDWLVIERGEIHRASSGTSLNAMSVLLEKAASQIAVDHGTAPDIDRIEDALRAGEETILIYGKPVALRGYLDQAAQTVAMAAASELRRAMRGDADAVDAVLIAGGGAVAYEAAARKVFPRSRIVIPDSPELANARGFWSYGVD
ncbi:MAG: ParM/StbA family protein [Acidiferrobacterales bacterium]